MFFVKFKKNETNKIHDFEKKITSKFQHVDINLNDFKIFDDYFRKFQIIDNKHHHIKNNNVKINVFFTRNKSSINKLNFKARRNEQYITNLKIKYTISLKKTYKIVIVRFDLKRNCRKCDKENHWRKKCIFIKSFNNWIDNLIKQKMLNLQIIFLINDNSSNVDNDNNSKNASIIFDVELKN